jgi:hypothetical protein
MMTAMLTVENIMAEHRLYDTWRVNDDAEYHEAGSQSSGSPEAGTRLTPIRLPQ